jgi:hypothetical protein
LLLGELFREALRLGLERVWATMEPNNFPALRLADVLGFRPAEYPATVSLDLRKLSAQPESLPQAA